MNYPTLKKTRVVKSSAERFVEPEKAPEGKLLVTYHAEGTISDESGNHALCTASIVAKGVPQDGGGDDAPDAFVVECTIEGRFELPEGMPSSGKTLSSDEVNALADYLFPSIASTVESGVSMIGYGQVKIAPSSAAFSEEVSR